MSETADARHDDGSATSGYGGLPLELTWTSRKMRGVSRAAGPEDRVVDGPPPTEIWQALREAFEAGLECGRQERHGWSETARYALTLLFFTFVIYLTLHVLNFILS